MLVMVAESASSSRLSDIIPVIVIIWIAVLILGKKR